MSRSMQIPHKYCNNDVFKNKAYFRFNNNNKTHYKSKEKRSKTKKKKGEQWEMLQPKMIFDQTKDLSNEQT